MSTNPPDLQDACHEPECHVGSDCNSVKETGSARNTCVRTRHGVTKTLIGGTLVVLALAGSPRESSALPPPPSEPPQDNSGMIDLNSLKQGNAPESPMPNVDEWSKMPWDEVVKKLDKMKEDRIKNMMLSMAPVLDEIKKISHEDMNKKLQGLQPLDDSEKEFFLELAEKYCPESLETIKYTFNKKILLKRDFHYLFVQFREILAGEDRFLSLYIHMREYLTTNRGWDRKESELARLKLMHKLLEGFERSCIFE